MFKFLKKSHKQDYYYYFLLDHQNIGVLSEPYDSKFAAICSFHANDKPYIIFSEITEEPKILVSSRNDLKSHRVKLINNGTFLILDE
jgi:hypothetical protein